jgi:S1-C subfamily serine protease
MHIRRSCLVSLLGVLLVTCLAPSAKAEQQILRSVVRIQAASVGLRSIQRGTGIVVEGGVITAAHVVENSAPGSINILCGDGDDSVVFDGELVYKDTLMDLALLKVKNDFNKTINLPPAKFDTSFPVQPGTEVYAIGNSLGFTRTISKGIVSASGMRSNEKFLYTDALTRKGNSGGPLIDHKGEVIGMVLGSIDTAPAGQTLVKDTAPEFTYTVTAADIVDFMASKGQIWKGYLGVNGKTVNTGLNQAGCDQGLQITQTTRDCGLYTGDIVFTVADTHIVTNRDLMRLIRQLQPGTTVRADILRNGQYKIVDLSITTTP